MALILFGMISIVTLVGLVLLFVQNYSATPYNVGDIYGQNPGIAPLTKLPPYRPGGPEPQFPAGPLRTIGSRTPAMIFFKGEYSNIYEMSKCWSDLYPAMAAAQDAFKCYAVPTSSPEYEVTGWFWPTSSALPRPLYDIGGDIYCYENFPYDRNTLIDRLKPIVLKAGWDIQTVNGEDVLMCTKGANFQFPQGLQR